MAKKTKPRRERRKPSPSRYTPHQLREAKAVAAGKGVQGGSFSFVIRARRRDEADGTLDLPKSMTLEKAWSILSGFIGNNRHVTMRPHFHYRGR